MKSFPNVSKNLFFTWKRQSSIEVIVTEIQDFKWNRSRGELIGIGSTKRFTERTRIFSRGSENRDSGRFPLKLFTDILNSCKFLRFSKAAPGRPPAMLFESRTKTSSETSLPINSGKPPPWVTKLRSRYRSLSSPTNPACVFVCTVNRIRSNYIHILFWENLEHMKLMECRKHCRV